MDSQVAHPHGPTFDNQNDPYNTGLPSGEGVDQQPQGKTSVMKKVKARAKKLKNSLAKRAPGGGHGHDQGHDDEQIGREYHHVEEEDDDDDDDAVYDDDEEMAEGPEIHGAPMYESAAIKSRVPKQDVNKGESGVSFGKVDVMEDVPKAPVSTPTSETTNQTRVNDGMKNFEHVQQGNQGHGGLHLGRSLELKEDPHSPNDGPESHKPANYQTKVADPTGAGGEEAGIAPILSSFGKMSVYDKPESKSPHQNPHIDQHIPPTGTHDQFTPDISMPTERDSDQPLGQFTPDTSLPTKKESDQPLDDLPAIKESGSPKIQSPTSSYTGKLSYATSAITGTAISAKNVVASKFGYGSKDENSPVSPVPESHNPFNPAVESREVGEGETTKAPSQGGGYGSTIYNKVAGAGTTVMSKVKSRGTGSETEDVSGSKPGYGGKDDNNLDNPVTEPREIGEGETTKSSSPVGGYGSTIYNKVAGAGTTVMSKVKSRGTGSETEDVSGSKPGYGGKDDNNLDNPVTEPREIGEGETTKSSSPVGGYGSTIASKFTPVYNTVAGAGATVMSKVTGRGTGSETEDVGGEGPDKSVPVKQSSWVEKLKPGEEDKALSEAISGSLYKRKDEGTEHKEEKPMGKVTESESVARRLGTGDQHSGEERVGSGEVKVDGADAGGANKGMVNMVKGAVTSWFGKGEVGQGQEGTEEHKVQESSN